MPGGSPDDLTFVPGGILNLGENPSEWGEDAFGRIGEARWSGRPLLVEPACRTGDSAVFRGGGWSLEAWTADARFGIGTTSAGASFIGFRCARDAR